MRVIISHAFFGEPQLMRLLRWRKPDAPPVIQFFGTRFALEDRHSDLTHMFIGGQVEADECERARGYTSPESSQAGPETEPCVSKSQRIIYTLIDYHRLKIIGNRTRHTSV